MIVTFSSFITMNPDCGTGHPIPDNLKLLFRPVATIVPDTAMIAEVSSKTVFHLGRKT